MFSLDWLWVRCLGAPHPNYQNQASNIHQRKNSIKRWDCMDNLKCPCGKIVCQIEGDTIIIKCRHCKRYISIKTNGIVKVESK